MGDGVAGVASCGAPRRRVCAERRRENADHRRWSNLPGGAKRGEDLSRGHAYGTRKRRPCGGSAQRQRGISPRPCAGSIVALHGAGDADCNYASVLFTTGGDMAEGDREEGDARPGKRQGTIERKRGSRAVGDTGVRRRAAQRHLPDGCAGWQTVQRHSRLGRRGAKRAHTPRSVH